jgi:hypothetical protein
MRAIDKFRCKIMDQVSNVGSFSKSWPEYSLAIDELISPSPNSEEIFNLGDYLSDIFTGSYKSKRSQSDVSGGGAAWESFATWYLNLIFWGTDVLVSRQNKKFIPQVLYDAFAVTISNYGTNTESDILCFSVPNTKNLSELTLEDINELVVADIKNVDTSIVQCKTNWNDNAQIPMLWDLIYNSTNFRIPNVSVGTSGVNPTSFKNFGYAFFTVPTIKDIDKKLKEKSVAVLRVKNLTGGNYWGKETKSGIAQSIKNYFGKNFGNHFNGGVKAHIENQLQTDPEYFSRFRNLNF